MAREQPYTSAFSRKSTCKGFGGLGFAINTDLPGSPPDAEPNPQIAKGKARLGINDVFHVTNLRGTRAPLNGRRLVVIGWGPECKMAARVLREEALDCDLFILNFNRVPNALLRHLRGLSHRAEGVDVLVIDPNPNAALMGPVMTELRRQLGQPRSLFFAECTPRAGYVPYGYGDVLLNAGDVRAVLAGLNAIEGNGRDGREFSGSPGTAAEAPAAEASETGAPPQTAATPSPGLRTVHFPLDGEGVYLTLHTRKGAAVAVDDLLAEVVSDKATVEITAPCGGVVETIHFDEDMELDVHPGMAFCDLRPSGGGDPVQGAAASARASASATSSTSAPTPSSASAVAPQDAMLSSGTHTIVPLSPCQLGMVKHMAVDAAQDTHTFQQFESIDFAKVQTEARAHGVTPTVVLVKRLADALARTRLNKRLSSDRRSLVFRSDVDVGLAVDTAGALFTVVVRDAARKALPEISADVAAFKRKAAAGKLGPQDLDLRAVCFTLTSIGKGATAFSIPVLPKGTAGILSVGRMGAMAGEGRSVLSMSLCHATFTGLEGAKVMRAFVAEME